MSRIILATLCALAVFTFSAIEASAANVTTGKTVYDASCVTCHKTGLMGAPKLGDKANWAPRIKKGNAVLVSNSTKGFKGKVGVMPAKGGNLKLTDMQIADAVAYMVSASK
ncbi:cytochrome c5 family protein [Chlorobium sp. BLA1]|uniref:c-type cytochrome n=1 Tax=Candidatus Chlorobium masyuteum TaxID=2716876 RepID=UPI00141DFBEF|nr:c-type cytochrome [Candidatus Chlorobium masyuteum]NHQ59494.1 cytochrome c5 family protein [Candidatus Chlorobium masyuteum]NTU45208.1 cytochrome c5 family protein [Chlorobiaceae bacterium]